MCYNNTMLKVIEPNNDLWESAVDFAKEVENAPTEFDIYASKHLIKYIDDMDAYLDFVEQCKHRIDGYVPNQTLWIVDDERVVGIFDLRLQLNEKLMNRGGNLAYQVAPSFRGKRTVFHAYPLLCEYIKLHYGFDRILITCDERNILSYKVILSLFKNFGGEKLPPVKISDTETQIRYWINVK